MFGGVTAAQLDQSNSAHVVNHMTLVVLLLDKGLVTAAEIAAARIQATHFVDQGIALAREEAEREFDEQYPGVRKLFSKVMGAESSG